MLTALMDGRALTVSELANAAGITIQTASGHLSKLETANILTAEKQGRHRYFRLSGHDIAHVLEDLMGLAQRTGAVRVRTGPRDEALRTARVCYDHLAGERGVALLDAVLRNRLIEGEKELALTTQGHAFFCEYGLDMETLEKGRRPVCRVCLDWSERRSHLGGALGAALLKDFIAKGWVRRDKGRVVTFTTEGKKHFEAAFGATPV